MKSIARATGLLALVLVLLSFLTNHDYLWGGIRETWLRGWENAQIDDLPYRDYVRTIPASSNPQPWPDGARFGKAQPSPEDLQWLESWKTASFLVIQHDSLVHESYFRGHDVTTPYEFFFNGQIGDRHGCGLGCGPRLGR